MVVLASLLWVAAVVGIGILLWLKYGENNSGDERKIKRWYWSIPVALVLLGFLSISLISVPAGNRGVVLRFGKVSRVMAEGLNVRAPLIENVVIMSVKTLKFEATATAASKDLQDVAADIAFNYKLVPTAAGEMYRTIGTDYIEVIAHPAIQEIVKEITARYNAEDMILRRAEVKACITEALTERLAERNIITEVVNITNFQFSDAFTAAIEAKVVAVQKILEATNKLEQIRVEAEQARIRAEGEASALVARANGQAEANEIVNASLTDNVLRYILLERIGSDIKVLVIPSDSAFVLPDLSV